MTAATLITPGLARDQPRSGCARIDAMRATRRDQSVQSAFTDNGAVLRAADLFHGVDEGAVRAVIGRMNSLYAERGTVLFRYGDRGDCLYVIVSGKVKLINVVDGREHLVALLGPGDEFGALSLLDPGPRTATATVVAEARLAQLPKAALEQWITDHPDVTMQLLRVLSRRLRRTRADIAEVVFGDVASRVARQLIKLTRRFSTIEAQHVRITHDLTQAELAQLVGASRESVNRTLADFAARGWIAFDQGSVLILDRAGISRRARSGPRAANLASPANTFSTNA